VFLREYGLEWYFLFFMDPPPTRILETWNYRALYLFFFLVLPSGMPVFFFCSIAPYLLSLKDLGEMCWKWLEYLVWKAIFVDRIKSRRRKWSDLDLGWWRNVWWRWML
jgi:hypothetical protein